MHNKYYRSVKMSHWMLENDVVSSGTSSYLLHHKLMTKCRLTVILVLGFNQLDLVRCSLALNLTQN